MIPNRRRFLALSACAAASPAAGAVQTRTWAGRALGADVTLRAAGASRAQARAFFAASARALRQLEAALSLFRDSDLVRLNRDGRLRFPPRAMMEMLALTDRLHGATGGAFDPTVQPMWRARARGAPEDTARDLTGWGDVAWSAREVRLARRGMALTFNGIAQGWAADRLAAIARDHDLTDTLVDTGEIVATGRRDWPAAISGPDGRILRRLILRGRALATSSPGGTRIGPHKAPHILHPRATPRWATVSVSAPSAALADGLSTALCLMTHAEARATLARLPGCRIETMDA